MALKRDICIGGCDIVYVGDTEGPHEHIKTVKIIETTTREIRVYSNEELDDVEVEFE